MSADNGTLLTGCELFPVEPGASPFGHRMGCVAYPGAPACPVCGHRFKTYVLLDPSDERLGIQAEVPSLPVLYCHDCETATGILSYRVDAAGAITILQQYRGERFDDWPQPHGECGVDLRPVPRRFHEILLKTPNGWFDYTARLPLQRRLSELILSGRGLRDEDVANLPAVSDEDAFMEDYELGRLGPQGREGFHQFGGLPFWLQRPQVVTCPGCSQQMPFLLSLGSDGRFGWQFGDCGRLYVFFCGPCRVVACFLQCG